MSNIVKCFIVSVWLIVLNGCASSGGTPVFMPPVGSTVEVTELLEAASGARLFIQNGRALPRRDVDVINPYCQFRLNRSGDGLRESVAIQPDTFKITRTYRDRNYAAAEGLQFAGFRTNSSLATVMELSSDLQPEITELACMRWGGQRLDGFVTIEEMQATLGGLVDLTLVN